MNFPEVPQLIYPSLARLYGVEASLLLYLYTLELNARGKKNTEALLSVTVEKEAWLSLADYWNERKIKQLTDHLVTRGAIDVHYGDQGQVILTEVTSTEVTSVQSTVTVVDVDKTMDRDDELSVDEAESFVQSTDSVLPPLAAAASFENESQGMTSAVAFPSATIKPEALEAASPSAMQILPVYDAPPAPAARSLPRMEQSNTLKGRGPAPTFGGSIGWKKRSSDELQQVFAQQEELNKQLHSMTMNWLPSQMFYTTLQRSGIPQEFAQKCLDEFILYYCDKNTKERSWDQKFLAWIKRDWVKQQGNDNRQNASKQQSGYSHENSQRDTREKRKRITAAIMDINDTNW